MLLLNKMNIVFKMMNTLNMKKSKKLKLKLTNCKKVGIEIHCIKPQVQAH